MKKLVCIILVFGVIAGTIHAQAAVTLDRAIQIAVDDIETALRPGTIVVVLNFNSPSERFSNYVLGEMMGTLVRNRRLIIVDRANLELIRQEMDFQLSGYVSDDSLQAIGHKLGAQSIISGSLEDIGRDFRIRFQTIEVVTAAIQVVSSITVRKDRQTTALLEHDGKARVSTGMAVGYGAMNIAFGLGSYLQGDITGGIIITSGYAIAAGLTIYELTALDWDHNLAAIPGTIGLGIAGTTLVFGFVRPLLYNMAPRVAAVMDKVQVVPAANSQNSGGLNIRYTHRF